MSVNQLDSNGLQIKTLADIITSLTTSFQTIYGSDINVDPNSPDGQIINIQSQANEDLLELLLEVYNSFDPDTAYGTILDQRLAINGVARTAGTYTLTPVSITVDRSLTLPGLDLDPTDPFIVNDGAGNNFILLTRTALTAGTTSLDFRAEAIGQVQPALNTITNQTTVTLGVTAVNNPLTYTYLGIEEETDSEFKVRRTAMFKLAATGPADSVRAAILDLDGVTDCLVGENNTGSPSGGIDAHSIWVIVEGGTDADIANAIYVKKSSGCGMTLSGTDDVTVTVTRPAGDTIDIDFNRPIEQDLYIKFTMTAKVAGTVFDEDAIKAALILELIYKLGQSASIDEVIIAMSIIEPGAYITACEVSDDGAAWVELLATADIQTKFILDVARITIS